MELATTLPPILPLFPPCASASGLAYLEALGAEPQLSAPALHDGRRVVQAGFTERASQTEDLDVQRRARGVFRRHPHEPVDVDPARVRARPLHLALLGEDQRQVVTRTLAER